MGNGLFDGVYLVENFENLDPANSLWTKYYNLYSKIDTEADRFLEFEAWWTGYFFMNAEEMDAIVSDLFIGNKLERGLELRPGGEAIDLSRITAPVVIFASRADNITPPQQALDWIDDVYGSEQALIDHDRTIVYLLREDVGHLAIFVSSRVAKKEITEIISTLEMIEALPPGLYQMVIDPKVPKSPHVDLEPGQYLVRFEARKMADIRSIEGKRQMGPLFQTVERVSRLNDEIYKLTLQPWIRLATTEASAELLRQMHPARVVREFFSDLNPALALTAWLAPAVRAFRNPVAENNPLLALEHLGSERIIALLNAYRDVRDEWCEDLFQTIYGPWGWGAIFPPKRLARQSLQLPEPSPLTDADFVNGGIVAAVFRLVAAACLDVGIFDHRSAIILHSVLAHKRFKHLDHRRLRALFRLQARLLRADPSRAASALGRMLPSAKLRREAVTVARQVLDVVPREEALTGVFSRRLLGAIDDHPAKFENYGINAGRSCQSSSVGCP